MTFYQRTTSTLIQSNRAVGGSLYALSVQPKTNYVFTGGDAGHAYKFDYTSTPLDPLNAASAFTAGERVRRVHLLDYNEPGFNEIAWSMDKPFIFFIDRTGDFSVTTRIYTIPGSPAVKTSPLYQYTTPKKLIFLEQSTGGMGRLDYSGSVIDHDYRTTPGAGSACPFLAPVSGSLNGFLICQNDKILLVNLDTGGQSGSKIRAFYKGVYGWGFLRIRGF